MAGLTKEQREAKAAVADMNALALRIWDGQSPDLPLIERVHRIKNALIAKGFELDGLTLPDKDFKKYL
jgi:hypothetical protein